MGGWSMSPKTLDFLETRIRANAPHLIVEMGGGLSTLCLARYMYETHRDSDGIYVCSIEQDPAVIEKTTGRLRDLGLEGHVRMFHAPLSPQTVAGVTAPCYTLPREFSEAMRTLRPDFVVIDGPAAEAGARFGTLPLVRPFLRPGTPFFLDDALRDGEIGIAERWKRLPGIRVDGVMLTEKGMLTGIVE
jgi:predicted O-methyltransferase YrrM